MTVQEAIEILRDTPIDIRSTREDDIHTLYATAQGMAIEALKGNGVAQERKYTFGNDEFNLESAYHDCKLVFDGITDDDSFQEVDTGLILYYANEIIYALHEALSCSEEPNRSDVIKRQDAIDVVKGIDSYFVKYIEDLPSAQPELIEKEAYIRGFEQGRTQGMIDAQGEKK